MQNRKRDTDVQNRLLDSVGEGEGGMFQENSIETCILSMVKQITSPGWMHETSAQAWCTGKTQSDRVEREVGGGIWMGNTCKSMADSFQCMTKPLQYCKVISLQLIKKKNSKKKIVSLLLFGLSMFQMRLCPATSTSSSVSEVVICRAALLNHLSCLGRLFLDYAQERDKQSQIDKNDLSWRNHIFFRK